MKNILLKIIFGAVLLMATAVNGQQLTLPDPDYSISIPMRDGFLLPTDIYLPEKQARNLPCILLRSPAGKMASHWRPFVMMKNYGYAVVIQDTRSALDPEGKTIPFISDGWGKLQDGYDTVEWLAESEFTNGKIGSWGSSALGITQLLMAPSNPPHLVCQYMLMSASSLYHHAIFPGGVLLKDQVEGWLGQYAKDPGVLNYICNKYFYNEFWQQLNTLSVAQNVQTPAIHVAGWYDTFLQGTLDAFSSRQHEGGAKAKGSQKLIVGPWTHYWPTVKTLGSFEMPKNAEQPPYDISPKRWFDYYLKGEKNGVTELPPVIYYLMGPLDGSSHAGNTWKTAQDWPVKATEQKFYLSGDHALTKNIVKDGSLSYLHDPKKPILTKGGRNLFLPSGPIDQGAVENREDMLCFTTAALANDIEITGEVKAKIFFESSQADTDIIVQLCDQYPDGRTILITEGAIRLATCGQTSSAGQAYEIDMSSTSYLFPKGHKIRLLISSSSYPRFAINKNVGIKGSNSGKKFVAKNRVLMGSKHPSAVLLPVIMADENP